MASGAAGKKVPEKSYLSSAVDSINPWATPATATDTASAHSQLQSSRPRTPSNSGAAAPKPDDHSTTHLYGRSFRKYPSDCPPLKVQWFHAVDVPKRKPQFNAANKAQTKDDKPAVPPKKYNPFSASDSRSIEAEYQRLLEESEDRRASVSATRRKDGPGSSQDNPYVIPADEENTAKVAVNEDYLFDVDIGARELGPVYWLGPIYAVRRGTWFYQDGSNLRPCEENLAAQLEDGFLKMKPWIYPARDRTASGTWLTTPQPTPKGSTDNLRDVASSTAGASSANPGNSNLHPPQNQRQSHRLFGTYMNNVVTYEDSNTAWLTSDGVLSWVASSVYERFAGGGYMSGVKLIRGYSEASKTKEEKAKEKDEEDLSYVPENALGPDEKQKKLLNRRSAPATTRPSYEETSSEDKPRTSRQATLQRQLSSLIESEAKDPIGSEEAVRRREESEIQEDYTAQAGETQGREIEHLVLVTHGIGQMLSLRMESINFVHDVNVLRKTLKSAYSDSADLKALNSELGAGPGNCRVQVLPVCWRHLLDFPKRREKKKEHDLGDVTGDEDEYPSLDDITVEGVTFARSLISDLALDVLLYQSAYRQEITSIVLGESNRIGKLFKERNPNFKGKVHLVGHSLGSAILFDILCQQRERTHYEERSSLRIWPAQERGVESPPKKQHLQLEFDVGDFYCLGSPVGLFQMLKGRTIAARQSASVMRAKDVLSADNMDESFRSAALSEVEERSSVSGLPVSVASPKCQQLFNIFHPSDPISYRLEPLISTSMKGLKPQLLPYTKKGIFGNVAPQGLTGLGAKVGQSVSGLWSSLSAGIASNLLNRSLGLTNEEVARVTASAEQQSGINAAELGDKTDARKKKLAADSAAGNEAGENTSENGPTLIDDELETLYSKFQQTRAELIHEGDSAGLRDVEGKARKMRGEENKVRALNRNGRVDYSIQESALDFNPMNTIASHMSYWGDEDVSHFMLSQLLSNRTKRSRSKTN